MRSRLLVMHFVLLVTAAACSSFEGQAGGVDAGSDTSADDGGSDGRAADTSTADDAPLDALADPCVRFDGPGPPPGWKADVQGAPLAFAAPFMGRNAMEANVRLNGQRALLIRELVVAAGGRSKVTVDLQTTAPASPNLGWLVDLVKITCTAPASVLRFASVPGGSLLTEVSPANGNASVTMAPVAPSYWSTLVLDIADDTITASFAGQTKELKIATSGSYGKLPLCTLAVGAEATGNVPQTTVRIARVCVGL